MLNKMNDSQPDWRFPLLERGDGYGVYGQLDMVVTKQLILTRLGAGLNR